jgi:hypothetical protein
MPMQREQVMFLTQACPSNTSDSRARRANEGDLMTTAADLSGKIEDFLNLSHSLNLTLPEEQTLVSLDASDWQRWRSFSVPPAAIAPPLLVRRLDYAIALMRRMVAATAPGSQWAGPGESRL